MIAYRTIAIYIGAAVKVVPTVMFQFSLWVTYVDRCLIAINGLVVDCSKSDKL
jgi:hypothetical protein